MARSRNIKPGITKNHKLAKLPFETRLLFSWLPMFADHKGLMEDIPEKIHAEIFPYDKGLDMDKMLKTLNDNGFINRFKASPKEGQDPSQTDFIFITNFCKHQNPHKKERDNESNFPEYRPESMIPGIDPENPGLVPVKNGASPADSLNLIPDTPILTPSSPESATDPFFQTKKEKPNIVAMTELCGWIEKNYKSTEFASKTLRVIQNLIHDVNLETIKGSLEKAIEIFDAEGRKQRYRPSLMELFPNAQAVKDMLKREVVKEKSDFEKVLEMRKEKNEG